MQQRENNMTVFFQDALFTRVQSVAQRQRILATLETREVDDRGYIDRLI